VARADSEQVAAVIVAAGSGVRLPGDVPKPFQLLGSRWILERAVAPFARCAAIEAIAVVVAEEWVEAVRARMRGYVTAVVAGGPSRRASVAAGLSAVPDAAWVVVHDGVRPFVTEHLIGTVLDAARRTGAAIAGLEVSDTLKRVADGRVTATVDRTHLWAVQTPQAFRASLLREAHRRVPAEAPVTDDAELVARLGAEVSVVRGDPANMKITTPQDLALARRWIAATEGSQVRVGIGYDVHRLVPDRALVLGGVTIPYPRGLDGHSDADVLAHAIMDALLGAAGDRDIGYHFPTTDPAYKDVRSLELLARVVERLRDSGWSIGNVDATVLAEAPKLEPHIEVMRNHLGAVLGIAPERVGIKATTSEGLGPIGRKEGIAAHAVALLTRTP
jgi:2-C-methyl-D-erythritol 4-phosphate cytidylyltransferase/2-C-methyl-D-erythritol 2,4-cyclodiphosphate synthase